MEDRDGILEIIKSRFPFYDKLNEEQKKLLLDGSRKVSYKKGQSVYDASHECVGMLLIESGELRVYLLSPDGREITLYWLEKGGICALSASCLLKNITFDVHIEARANTGAVLINPSAFSRVMEESLYAENFFLKLTADRFSDVMWSIQQLLFLSVDKRLAAFLIDESVKRKTDKLMLTKDEIARYMGTAREVISRMLNEFSRQNAVSLFRGGVSITNKAYLKGLI